MREPSVASVMTSPVVTVELHTPVREVTALLVEHGISAVPVLDGGAVAGVVSEADLLANREYRGGSVPAPTTGGGLARWRKAFGATASHVMTTPAIVIAPDAPVSEAIALLAQSTVRRLFVVDHDGVLVGVLARRDLLRDYLREDDDIRADVRRVLREDVGVDPDLVVVSVREGRVRLSGWLERRGQVDRALASVRLLPGVVDVHGELGCDER
ncbi:CBS domain-containing protein [Umezawaea sp.]|uniref:CBS domain-containing protein n=1 Tax=Umezawaea sp. TaxID=1955258 RepID=UPI002ED10B51